ncbi:MAG: S9 family peptidase [Ignavibacteria bacterium]|nr:S9 family peptidase [Ignavibacteria bacterium]
MRDRIHRLLSAACVVMLVFTPRTSAQQTDSTVPLKRIFFKPYIAGSRPTDPTISPNGNIILFRWDSTALGTYRYWFMRSDGTEMRQIPDTLLGNVEWSPDSKTIACTRKGDVFLTDTSFQLFQRITKTDAEEQSLRFSPDGNYLVCSSGGKILALALHQGGVFDVAKPTWKDGSISFIDFSQDGRKVLVVESSNDSLAEFVVPRYTGKDVSTRSFKGGVGKTRIGVATLTDTGAIVWVKLPGDERFYLGDAAFSSDRKSVIVERFSSDRKLREIFVADTDSGKATKIYEEKDKAWVEGGLSTTHWMPDGKYIITTSEQKGWNHLYLLRSDGKDKRQLTDGDWEIHWFDVLPSGRAIIFLANKDDHHQWQLYSLDLSSKEITRLTARQGSYDGPVLTKDGSFVVARYSDFDQPSELVRVSTQSQRGLLTSTNHVSTVPVEEVQLTHSIPDEFRRVHWTIPEIVDFESKDGKTIPAMIYKPKNFNAAKKYPVVVFVHGAGYLQNVFRGWSYYYHEYMFHHRLTQRGYVVFEVDYRGSAGYGHDFRTDVHLYLGGKDLQDELDGLEYLSRLGYIDTQRVGIYGGSYGGFMTLMGLFLSDKYACGAALRAVSSWENYYKHNPWYTEARLGKPEENPDAYKKSSPLTFADSLKKPLLILHGMVDDNVFFQDAVQLINRLQKAGKKFEVMMYPDEAHSFTQPESWYDEYSRIEEFFDRYLMTEQR